MKLMDELSVESKSSTEEKETNSLWVVAAGRLREQLQATPRQYVLYAIIYFIWGSASDTIGKLLLIAEFRHWWQILTCYICYLVPVSLLVRNKSILEQYIYGVVALAPLELLGYALGTSIAHNGNVLDATIGPRNFTLAMCVFFGIIPPIGNGLVRWTESRFFGRAGEISYREGITDLPQSAGALAIAASSEDN